MATIRPFAALRPPGERAAEVAAVPYDVVNRAEARELAAGNPWSFLHVSRPEIDLADGVDPYSEQVYRKAAENFEELKRECPLLLEEAPFLYAYRLGAGTHEQTGIAGCFALAECDSGTIRKHERTRREKEDDRTRHMLTLRAQTGPVFLTYRDNAGIEEVLAEAKRKPPLFDFTAPDGVSHTIWRIEPKSATPLTEKLQRVPVLYIADGHHRVAAASRAREQLKAANAKHTGEEEYTFFLAVLFPASQVRILPYNRIVRELGGRSPALFLSALRERVALFENASPSPERRGEVRIYLEGRWYGLVQAGPPPHSSGSSSDPSTISRLDVSLLQDLVLEPLLGIEDVRTDERIDFVGGLRGTKELERLVDSGRAVAAFSMFPVSIEDLMRISDAGGIMPPKSTWFEPKLRDGLLIHVI